jgi:hypothetical protein
MTPRLQLLLFVMTFIAGGLIGWAASRTNAEPPPGVYLDLLKRSLMDLPNEPDPKTQTVALEGRDYPSRGLTMIGIKRLDQLQECTETVSGAVCPETSSKLEPGEAERRSSCAAS